jgi:hypothetical protein
MEMVLDKAGIRMMRPPGCATLVVVTFVHSAVVAMSPAKGTYTKLFAHKIT